MPFDRVWIQQLGQGALGRESRLVSECFARRGVSAETYLLKRLLRRQVPLTTGCFLAGDWDCVHAALTQLGVEVPAPLDYPECLAGFLRRKVWRSTLADVERALREGSVGAVFVKPADRQKRFTGRVVTSPYEVFSLGAHGRRDAVLCSEVVRWRGEQRAYVTGDQIVAIDRYEGDATVDVGAVREALATYRASGTAPAAFAMDFGVLDTGETALVEVNDGLALGAYEIDGGLYTELLATRWRELVAGV